MKARINHLIHDIYHKNDTWKYHKIIPSSKKDVSSYPIDGINNNILLKIDYEIFILYDEGLLSYEERQELENMFNKSTSSVQNDHLSFNKVKLFGFNALEMHNLYPTQVRHTFY